MFTLFVGKRMAGVDICQPKEEALPIMTRKNIYHSIMKLLKNICWVNQRLAFIPYYQITHLSLLQPILMKQTGENQY